MKKVLFASALVALAASCTENELDSISAPNGKGEGISFEVEQAPTTRMQWDETETSYVPFWYAEQDRIGIFAVNVGQGAFDAITPWLKSNGHNWQGIGTPAAVAPSLYKATQSQQAGAFTAVSDADLLHFNGDKDARFLAVYPGDKVAGVQAEYKDGTIVLSNLPALATQEQTTTKGNNKATLMYSMSIASKENSYDAVGEKVNLKFHRPLSALVLSTENVDEYTKVVNGSSIFGKLKTIDVTAKGYLEEDGTATTDPKKGPSALIYNNTDATVVIDTADYKATVNPGDIITTPVNFTKVSLTLGATAGLDWSDDALAIMSINNVERKNFSASKPETMEVVFKFENIDLTMMNTTASSWNGFIEYPALDIDNYPYLVTKGTAAGSNDRTLIVNSGHFEDIFDEDGDVVVWTDEHNGIAGEVAKTEFKEIIINEDVVLNDAEFELLNQFTAVEKLTLKGNTEIKKNALKGLAVLKSINMPLVTKVAKDAFVSNVAFEEVLLPAYKFDDKEVYGQLLNKASLKVLDMSSVEQMTAGFPATGLSLNGFDQLTTVTVKDGVKVGSNAFGGCELLTTVKGTVDLVGTSAFAGCEALVTININGTVIPANTFDGAKALKNVLYNGKQVVPTVVDAQAFNECEALEEINLANVTKLGQEAFNGCKKLVGIKKANNGKNVLTVGAEYISEGAFKDCEGLEYVYFTNANGFGADILNISNNYQLKEVKFGTVLLKENVKTANEDAFGGSSDVANVKLFVNPDQDVNMINNATLILRVATTGANSQSAVEITFKSIDKEAKY